LVGAGTVIGRNAQLGADHSIGTDATVGRAVVAGERLTIANGGTVGYGVQIGDDVTVGADAVVGNLANLGDYTTLGDNAVIARGVTIADAPNVGSSTAVNGVVGPDATVAAGARIEQGARVRKLTAIGAGAAVESSGRVGRGSTIADGATVFGRVGANATVGAGATVESGAIVGRAGEVCSGATLPTGSDVASDGTWPVEGCFEPTSCQAIKTGAPSSADGTYNIDPDGVGGIAALDVYCDMTTDGGGWTLLFREDFTDVEDGPTQSEMNSSGGDLFTGEGRTAPSPVGLFSAMGSTDIMYDLETQKLVTPNISATDWTWFMSATGSASVRTLASGAYFVGGTTYPTAYLHKWSQGQGQVSTNTTWDSSIMLDYGQDANHGWALWTGSNGTYKRLDGYQTPENVTTRIWAR
jgi:carbonic anhydrase/acetyltransferase-like protein (isoleucine patch superfamily)